MCRASGVKTARYQLYGLWENSQEYDNNKGRGEKSLGGGGGGKGNVAIVFQSFTSRKGDCSTLVVFLPLFSFFPPHF